MLRLRHALLFALSYASGACKIGEVNVRAHLNEGEELDSSVLDGAAEAGPISTSEDAGPSGGQLGQPCIDRGAYAMDGRPFRGLAATCDDKLACVAGTC